MSGEQTNPHSARPSEVERRQLFISYSHKDGEWLERIHTHLKPLERRYGLERWDDSRIQAGDRWREAIETALARAQVALLLVSPDFLASDFIHRSELPPLFQAAAEDGLEILWLPLRPSSWRLHPEIETIQAIFPPGRTLAEMGEAEQDRQMVAMTETLQEILLRPRVSQPKKPPAEALPAEPLEEKGETEVERWRAEAERLAAENARIRQQATFLAPPPAPATPAAPPPAPAVDPPDPPAPAQLPEAPGLHDLDCQRGWLERTKNGWQVKTEPLRVRGTILPLTAELALPMVWIPGGEFLMGSPPDEEERRGNEGPQHSVKLAGFFLGQTPVTQAQWAAVARWPKQELDLNPDPSHFKGPRRPVEQVSWKEAMEFCRRLSQRRSDLSFTLPSEAQWEYACRAGTATPFAFGATLTPALANYDATTSYADGPTGQYRGKTTDVASFPANAWGLHDLHGNVWEWCLDNWHGSYEDAPTDGSPWLEAGGGGRLLRGGSWDLPPRDCRSACRDFHLPGARDYGVGFRVCCLPQD